jgi:hypothetical protein
MQYCFVLKILYELYHRYRRKHYEKVCISVFRWT